MSSRTENRLDLSRDRPCHTERVDEFQRRRRTPRTVTVVEPIHSRVTRPQGKCG